MDSADLTSPIHGDRARDERPVGECVLQRFTVPYEFPVYFTRGVFSPDNTALLEAMTRREPQKLHRFVVCCDENVMTADAGLNARISAYAARHAGQLKMVAPVIQVAGGERVKNDPTAVISLTKTLVELGIDRHSYVIGIGGGAVLDMVGYVAASLHRGVRHIRMPTTVLAQNDSGVGVKNGINTFGIKNLVGAFAPPFAVLNDIDFVTTLARRDRIAGLAEAVKVALIRDAGFFQWLEDNAPALAAFEPAATATMIRRCAEQHMDHIATSGDPFESGSTRPLDFGHWSAHKLEALTRNDVRHGEAVAIGIALDTHYSTLARMLSPFSEIRILRLLQTLDFGLWHPSLEARTPSGSLALLSGLDDFREHLGGELTVPMLTDIGRAVDVHEMDHGRVAACIEWLKSRERSA